jgi:hypothetical protein
MKFYYAVFFFILSFQLTGQETFFVNSQGSFDSALNSATAGDTIYWENGEYDDIVMDVEKDGLYIAARELGRTVFAGESYARLDGDDMVFRGFQYVGVDISRIDIVEIRGSNILFEQVNFRANTSYKYLRIREESQFVTVQFCNFERRLNLDDQNILSVLVDDNQPGFHKIQWCSFKNIDGRGDDFGIEPIRIGVSTQADFNSRTLVEFCYFTNCDGDGELISSKASQNVYRYNTFEDNPEAELVLRHGSENVVYANFFLDGKGGVRVREGQHHYIYNNYFYQMDDRPLFIQNEDSDPLDDINIAFNVIIDSREVDLGGNGGPNPPTNVTFANNIFFDPQRDLFEDPTGMETWVNNISFGRLGMSTVEGITEADPLLTANDAGFFAIAEGSPAIDGAVSGFKPIPQFEGMDPVDSNVDLDLLINDRPTAIGDKDLGPNEFPHDTPIQPMATEENTGPHYNTSEVTSTNEQLLTAVNVEVFPNPTSDMISLSMTIEESVDLDITLIDLQGRIVQTLYQEANFSGELTLSKSLSDLPDGTYITRVSGSENGVLKMEENIPVVKL